EHEVAGGQFTCLLKRLSFRQSRSKIEWCALADVVRNRLGDQLVEARDADGLQHRAHVLRRWSDVPALEAIGDRWIVQHCKALPQSVQVFTRPGLRYAVAALSITPR